MKPTSELIQAVRRIITQSRASAIRSVDTARVLMYGKIGQVIFEEEQQREDRAAYGTFLIKSLSKELKPQFGSGFSQRHLHWYVQFYRIFPIVNALRSQFSWTHYRTLLRIDNDDKREFYIEEARKNNWSARQLQRQVNSQLFERLLLSNDVASVLKVARAEKNPKTPGKSSKTRWYWNFWA